MTTVHRYRPRGILKTLAAALTSLLLITGLAGAEAGDARDFHKAVADAYGHYKEAIFYVRRGSVSVAAFEIEALIDKWRIVVDRFADNRPDAYGAEPMWRKTLKEIDKRARDGLAAAARNDAKATRKYLEPIREVLFLLRRRNNVVVFSDYVDETNVAFRALFRFRHSPPDFTDENQVNRLRKALAETIRRYQKCRDAAPEAIAGEEQFKRLITDGLFYLNRMWAAIDEKNQLSIVNILRRVVSSDKILWMRFG
ncbi:MAG: hypothetical protein V3R37_04260 [Rhodospirillales bacterium]